MRNTTCRWAMGALGVLALSLPQVANAAVYSNASLKGSYGFELNLHTASTSAIQFTDLGILTFDGAGNVHGSSSYVSEGTVTPSTFVGVYSVSANGSGVLTVTGGPQFALLLDSLSGGVASDVEMLRTDDTANESVSGNAVLQSTVPHTYNSADLRGTYFVQGYTISNDSTVNQTNSLAVDIFDGKGHVTLSLADVNDGVYTKQTASGTYLVNQDGTYSATLLIGGVTVNYIGVLNSAPLGHAKGAQATVVNDPRNVAYFISAHQ